MINGFSLRTKPARPKKASLYSIPNIRILFLHSKKYFLVGDNFSFVTRNESAFLWSIESVLGEELETRTLEDFDYGVPAPQGDGTFLRSRFSGSPNGFSKFAKQARVHRSTVSLPAPTRRRSTTGKTKRQAYPNTVREYGGGTPDILKNLSSLVPCHCYPFQAIIISAIDFASFMGKL